MMKKLFLILFLLFNFTVFSQVRESRLSFEFNYSIQNLAMKALNEDYVSNVFFQEWAKFEQLNSANLFGLRLSYKPNRFFDLGFYGNYQNNKDFTTTRYLETDANGQGFRFVDVFNTLKIQGIGVGFTSTFYFNNFIPFLRKYQFWRPFNFGVQLNGGLGFSQLNYEYHVPTLNFPAYHIFSSNYDFQGQSGLILEYDIINSNLITTFGLKLGYQYFVTKTLVDVLNRPFIQIDNKPINLDFSGFNLGFYIKLSH